MSLLSRWREFTKHYPGRHDQKTHGSWARGGPDALMVGEETDERPWYEDDSPGHLSLDTIKQRWGQTSVAKDLTEQLESAYDYIVVKHGIPIDMENVGFPVRPRYSNEQIESIVGLARSMRYWEERGLALKPTEITVISNRSDVLATMSKRQGYRMQWNAKALALHNMVTFDGTSALSSGGVFDSPEHDVYAETYVHEMGHIFHHMLQGKMNREGTIGGVMGTKLVQDLFDTHGSLEDYGSRYAQKLTPDSMLGDHAEWFAEAFGATQMGMKLPDGLAETIRSLMDEIPEAKTSPKPDQMAMDLTKLVIPEEGELCAGYSRSDVSKHYPGGHDHDQKNHGRRNSWSTDHVPPSKEWPHGDPGKRGVAERGFLMPDQSIHEYVEGLARNWSQMTYEEMQTLRWYTDEGYQSVNAELRKTGSNPTAEVIDKMAVTTDRDMVLYRGVKGAADKEKYQVLSRFVNPAFTSATTYPTTATMNYFNEPDWDFPASEYGHPGSWAGLIDGYTIIRIFVPKGAKIIPDAYKSSGENEVILPTNARFRVVGTTGWDAEYGIGDPLQMGTLTGDTYLSRQWEAAWKPGSGGGVPRPVRTIDMVYEGIER